MISKLTGITAMVALSCAACSASSNSSSSQTTYGEDALVLTQKITGCEQATRVELSAGSASTSSRVGSCLLLSHHLYVYTWPDASSEQSAIRLLRSGDPTFFATGPGWTAVVGDAAPPATQRRLAQAAADALHGTISSGP